MLKPAIHLNGTPAADLIRQTTDAMVALDLAIEAMVRAAPNGRDYYPQGADAVQQAQDEHRARIAAVAGVRDYYEDVVISC